MVLHSESLTGADRVYAVRQSSGIQEAFDHTRLLGDWRLSYEQLSRGRFQGSLTEAWVQGVHLYREQLRQSVFQSGLSCEGRVHIGVFESLSGEARWFGQPIGTGDVMFLQDGGELLLSTPKESALLVLSLPADTPLLGAGVPSGQNHLHHPELAQVVRAGVSEALHQLVTRPVHFAKPAVRQQFSDDMQGLVGDCLLAAREVPPDPCRSRAAQVVRGAMDHVQAQPAELPSIDELCRVTATSRRNLQKCFERMTGESPALFLKTQRLNAVRRDLLQDSGERLIGDVAAEWGFWHLSQFATDYKKLFGESPSETLRYARWSTR